MDQQWEKLIPMGLPYGAPRTHDELAFSMEGARRSLEAIEEDLEQLDPALREPLMAWLCGFRQHWNSSWTRGIGAVGDRLIEELDRLPLDPNRYLKLRRIAIENLSTLI